MLITSLTLLVLNVANRGYGLDWIPHSLPKVTKYHERSILTIHFHSGWAILIHSPIGQVTYVFLKIFCQWEFQDPKMEVLYHIRPYSVGIFPEI